MILYSTSVTGMIEDPQQRMKLVPISPKRVNKDLNRRAKAIKLLGGKARVHFCDLRPGNHFLKYGTKRTNIQRKDQTNILNQN